MTKRALPFDEGQVLAVLRKAKRARAWSSIAAEILGVDRQDVEIAEVRGIHKACRTLEGRGLLEKAGLGAHRATQWAGAARWKSALVGCTIGAVYALGAASAWLTDSRWEASAGTALTAVGLFALGYLCYRQVVKRGA